MGEEEERRRGGMSVSEDGNCWSTLSSPGPRTEASGPPGIRDRTQQDQFNLIYSQENFRRDSKPESVPKKGAKKPRTRAGTVRDGGRTG